MAFQVPPGFDIQEWSTHISFMIEEWLAKDFTWDDVPLSTYIKSVDVAHLGYHTVRQSSTAAVDLQTPDHNLELSMPSLDDAFYTMWHPVCLELIESWALQGRWLRPETDWHNNDQMVFSNNTGHLLVGVPDRENPASPRRYDPDQNPAFHDIGVVAFPIRPFRAVDYLQAGHSPSQAMLLCAGTAVAESVVHEALEMYQYNRGIPVLDPHTPGLTVEVSVQ